MGSQSWNSVGWCQQTSWVSLWAVWEAPSLWRWLISSVIKWARCSDSGCPGSKPPFMIIYSLSGYNNPFSSARKPCCLQRNMCRSETDLLKQVFRVKNIKTTCSRGAVDFTPANVRHPALLSPTMGPCHALDFQTEHNWKQKTLWQGVSHALLGTPAPFATPFVYIRMCVHWR